MTKDQFISYITREQNGESPWRHTAHNLKDVATNIQENDPILATMARRLALAINQYRDRMIAQFAELAVERLDKQQDEDNQMLEELFAKLGAKQS